MITITQNRVKDSERYPDTKHQDTIEKAFNHLAYFELGYGGKITEIEKTKVTVVTRIMSCTDTAIFEGSEEEMTLLVELAVLAIQIDPFAADAPQALTDAVVKDVMAFTNGSPLLIKMGHGMIEGKRTLPMMLVGMLIQDKGDDLDLDLLSTLSNKSVNELIPLVMLTRHEKLPLTEVLTLV